MSLRNIQFLYFTARFIPNIFRDGVGATRGKTNLVAGRFLVGLFLSFFMSVNADDRSDMARHLLYEAKEFTSKASFKSTTPIYKDGEVRNTVYLYRLSLPDGKIMEKIENIWQNSLKETYISNESGVYIFLGTMTLKSEVPFSHRKTIFTSIDDSNDKDVLYSFSEDVYKDIPCYKVTVKIPSDATAVDDRIAKFWRISSDPEKYVRANLPFTKVYYIGKENHFIYSCSFYNLQGNKISSISWGDVDINASIDKSIFDIPVGDNTVLLEKNSERFKQVNSLFSVPDSDSNETESKKQVTETRKSEKAREILFAAMKKTKRTSFSAKSVGYKGGKMTRTVNSYHKALEDGTVQERVEYSWPTLWKEIYVQSKNGAYVQINNTLIKTDFKIGSRTFIYNSVKNDILENAAYSMTEEDYKSTPCYKITVKIPSDPAYVTQRLARAQRYANGSDESLLETLPFVKTFFVGKKNLFIYSCAFYNIQGRRTVSEEWGDVVFDAPMSNDLFEAPRGHAVAAYTRSDFDRIRARCTASYSKK